MDSIQDTSLLTRAALLSALSPAQPAPAVATKEATDGDSNGSHEQSFNAIAVDIRKQAEPANGYRAEQSARFMRERP